MGAKLCRQDSEKFRFGRNRIYNQCRQCVLSSKHFRYSEWYNSVRNTADGMDDGREKDNIRGQWRSNRIRLSRSIFRMRT